MTRPNATARNCQQCGKQIFNSDAHKRCDACRNPKRNRKTAKCPDCGNPMGTRANYCANCIKSKPRVKTAVAKTFTCPDCGNSMSRYSDYCQKCSYKHRKSYRNGRSKTPIYYFNRYKSKNPQKAYAHMVIGNMVRLGKLVHGKCQMEGCEERGVEFHHPDYSRPSYVIDLCKKHHKEVHRGGDLASS